MPHERFSQLQQHKEALLACVTAFEQHAHELARAEAALREREATITALFDNASQGIITIDRAGRILQANGMARRLFGYEELVGMQVENLLPEELGEQHKRHREGYFSAPHARPMGLGIELSGRRRDGSTFPVEISLSHVTTAAGPLAVAFITDIAARKQAEQALRQSEESNRALLENASQGIVTIDAGGTIVQVNAMAERLFGYAREELVGQRIEALLPVSLRSKHEAHRVGYFQEPRSRPMGIGIDLSARRKDGTEFPVEISLSHVTTRDGVLAVAFVSDITERKHAEATIRALLESASQAIIGVNSAGGIVMANAMTERLFGYTRQELIGRSIEVLLPERVREQHVSHRSGYFTEPRTRPMGIGLELSARRKDASEFPVEISLSHVSTESGVLAVAFVTDITERKRAEEAVVLHAENLARSNADLQQFAYVASHDLQEPIRTVTAFSELLAREHGDKLTGEAEELIRHILAAANRMEVLVRDLLAYTRVVNQSEPGHTAADARVAVEWATKNLHQAIEESRAQISVEALPTVNSELSALVQVFQNLIINAIKYRKPGELPDVRISAAVNCRECVFSVEDSGVGIPAAYHETVFGLFQRLDRSVSGTGLGLAICRRIVEKYGGRMWVESEPGRGSRFKFTLHTAEDGKHTDTNPAVSG